MSVQIKTNTYQAALAVCRAIFFLSFDVKHFQNLGQRVVVMRLAHLVLCASSSLKSFYNSFSVTVANRAIAIDVQKCFRCCWRQHIIRRCDVIITEHQELVPKVTSELQTVGILCSSLANQNGNCEHSE